MIGTPARPPRGQALAIPAIVAAMVVSVVLAMDSWPAGSVVPASPSRPAMLTDNQSPAAGRLTPSIPGKPQYWHVHAGDTYAVIASATGVTVRRLRALNPRLDPNLLNAGDSVKVHRASARR